MQNKRCGYCRQPFLSKRAGAKTCSPKCRKALSRITVTDVTLKDVTDKPIVTDEIVTDNKLSVTDKDEKKGYDLDCRPNVITPDNVKAVATAQMKSKKPFWSNLDKSYPHKKSR